MKNATKIITRPELAVGMIVQFDGARFEITSTKLVADHQQGANGDIMVANGKWIDGNVTEGYYGPNKDWNFQGNRNATACVEI